MNNWTNYFYSSFVGGALSTIVCATYFDFSPVRVGVMVVTCVVTSALMATAAFYIVKKLSAP